jgi:hypothetical protein
MVLYRDEDHLLPSGEKLAKWVCLCDCGKETSAMAVHLKAERTKSCGCRVGVPTGPRIDLTGNVYGRLTVLRWSRRLKRMQMWWCRCVCGNELEVWSNNLNNHTTQSCGCLVRVEVPSYNTQHKRMSTRYGPPSTHGCVDCSEMAHEWSYDNGCSEEIIQVGTSANGLAYCLHDHHYHPRCRPCHRRFDAAQRGHFGPYAREIVRSAHRALGVTKREYAAVFGGTKEMAECVLWAAEACAAAAESGH